ncbi:hypothetical protein E2C01_062351 [Portunus trituberculatus]|uniref:Uncharacterized protein n=1 Tax=Portunus trituberculatus TaxID=210409 RepID=A0A5B7HHS3_PORTR|nr:hypothetical protein [Portunus trituberculatus]
MRSFAEELLQIKILTRSPLENFIAGAPEVTALCRQAFSSTSNQPLSPHQELFSTSLLHPLWFHARHALPSGLVTHSTKHHQHTRGWREKNMPEIRKVTMKGLKKTEE